MVKIWKKLFSFVAISALLVNLLSPALQVYAQEVTPAETPTPTETPIPTITPDNSQATISATPADSTSSPQVDSTIPSENPIPSPDESPATPLPAEPAVIDTSTTENQSSATLAPPIWQTNTDGSATTTNTVTLNTTYKAPQNDKVSVTFTKLPQNPGKLKIEQISTSNLSGVNPVTDIAYDITSDMTNGTFEYILTLPTPTTDNVEVKTSEDGQNFVTVGNVAATGDTLTITGLDHFTIFVVVNPTPSGEACIDAGADTGTGCYSTIQAAIDAAASGDTINVAAGNYTTTGQVLIDKNLTIVGTGEKPVIQPDADLPVGDNNASGAWFLVNEGIT
ncbi:MAG: hypothetical protein WD896_00560, partial [Parcubacteria group bacterium]